MSFLYSAVNFLFLTVSFLYFAVTLAILPWYVSLAVTVTGHRTNVVRTTTFIKMMYERSLLQSNLYLKQDASSGSLRPELALNSFFQYLKFADRK